MATTERLDQDGDAAAAWTNERPRHLFMQDQGLAGVQGARRVLSRCGSNVIEEISLGHNQLGNHGCVELFEGLKQLREEQRQRKEGGGGSFKLRKITLSSNQIGNEALDAITDYLCRDETLEELYLPNNQIKETRGMYAFGQSIATSRLTGLSLNSNELTADALEQFLQGLYATASDGDTNVVIDGHCLVALHLSGNPFGDLGAQILAAFLGDCRQSRHLSQLTLNQCDIQSDGLRALSVAIEAGNFMLTRLEIAGNPTTTSDPLGRREGERAFGPGDDPLVADAGELLDLMEQVDMIGPGAEYAVAQATSQIDAEGGRPRQRLESIAVERTLIENQQLDARRRENERASWERIRASCPRVPCRAFLKDVEDELTGDAPSGGGRGSSMSSYRTWANQFGYLSPSTTTIDHLRFRTHHTIRKALERNQRLKDQVRSTACKVVGVARIILLAEPIEAAVAVNVGGHFPILNLPVELRLAVIRSTGDYPELLSESQWNRLISHVSDRQTIHQARIWWQDASNDDATTQHISNTHMPGHPGQREWARTVLEEQKRLAGNGRDAWQRQRHANAFERLLLQGIGIDAWDTN